MFEKNKNRSFYNFNWCQLKKELTNVEGLFSVKYCSYPCTARSTQWQLVDGQLYMVLFTAAMVLWFTDNMTLESNPIGVTFWNLIGKQDNACQ